MSDNVSFNYTHTEHDYQGAIRAHVSTLKLLWSLSGFGALFAIVAISAYYSAINSWISFNMFFAVVWASGSSFVALLFYTWSLNRKFAEHISRKNDGEIDGTADAEGITLASKSGETETAWTGVIAATETQEFFLFHRALSLNGSGNIDYIPKRAFVGASALDRFRELVRSSISKARLLA